MTRMSKQMKRRAVSPRKRHLSLNEKTGPKKDQLAEGYKKHINAISEPSIDRSFIPRIK